MLKRFFAKKRNILCSTLVLAVAVALVIPFVSSAKMVDVYTKSSAEEHLMLDWVELYGPKSQGYRPTGEMVSQMAGVYSIKTNSWGSWYDSDAAHYACTAAPFNAGSKSVLTVQATFDSLFDYKQFGIMIRKSLDADSESVWLNLDVSRARIDYRDEKAGQCNWAKINYNTDISKKVHVKAVIQKDRGIAELYIQYGDTVDEANWNKLMSKSFRWLKKTTNLYAGICVSAEPDAQHMAEVTFSNFSVNLQAPEGYTIEDGSGSGGDGGDEGEKPSEPTEKLPDDLAAAGDALLYETFTDGNLYPTEEQQSVTNPLWTVRTGEAVVKLDEAKKNRYLAVEIDSDPLFVETGDMKWTDYSMQAEFSFPEDTIKEEDNRVEFLVRERSAYVGGLGYYGVTLYNKFVDGFLDGQYLMLESKNGLTSSWTGTKNSIIFVEKKLANADMISLGTTHTIKVDVFDNTITVYLDDMSAPIIEYTDTRVGGSRVQDPHLLGGIGLMVMKASVNIDNIVVRKLYDPLGGDYDNQIMGAYDQPIPEWIEKDYMK